jgi:GNAT superfamily N-acetyltransferase
VLSAGKRSSLKRESAFLDKTESGAALGVRRDGLPPGYSLRIGAASMDIELVHSVLAGSYWAAGIPRELVKKSLGNSLCIGLFDNSGVQVAFARAVTDEATFAYLADIFVVESLRGSGLGKNLVAALLAQPELQGLRRIMLATRDAHALYAKYGFTDLDDPEIFMQQVNRRVYQTSDDKT